LRALRGSSGAPQRPRQAPSEELTLRSPVALPTAGRSCRQPAPGPGRTAPSRERASKARLQGRAQAELQGPPWCTKSPYPAYAFYFSLVARLFFTGLEMSIRPVSAARVAAEEGSIIGIGRGFSFLRFWTSGVTGSTIRYFRRRWIEPWRKPTHE